jgi:hypothetical protein
MYSLISDVDRVSRQLVYQTPESGFDSWMAFSYVRANWEEFRHENQKVATWRNKRGKEGGRKSDDLPEW